MFMQIIDRVNHMALVNVVFVLAGVLVLLILLSLRLRKALIQVRLLSGKLDQMIDQLIEADPGDYALKSETFNNVRKKYHDQSI